MAVGNLAVQEFLARRDNLRARRIATAKMPGILRPDEGCILSL